MLNWQKTSQHTPQILSSALHPRLRIESLSLCLEHCPQASCLVPRFCSFPLALSYLKISLATRVLKSIRLCCVLQQFCGLYNRRDDCVHPTVGREIAYKMLQANLGLSPITSSILGKGPRLVFKSARSRHRQRFRAERCLSGKRVNCTEMPPRFWEMWSSEALPFVSRKLIALCLRVRVCLRMELGESRSLVIYLLSSQFWPGLVLSTQGSRASAYTKLTLNSDLENV